MTEERSLVPLSPQAFEEIREWEPFKELSKKPPDTAIKKREGSRGQMFAYLPTDWVVGELNRIFSNLWRPVLLKGPDQRASKVYVDGRIVDRYAWDCVVEIQVVTPWGILSRIGAGSQVQREDMEPGDAAKGAISDGIKKAASLFGKRLGLGLREDTQPPDLVKEASKEDLRSVLEATARRIGISWETVEGLAQRFYHKPVSGLSREETMRLIQELNKGGGI